MEQTIDRYAFVEEVKAIIAQELPGFWSDVIAFKSPYINYISVYLAVKDYNINGVKGQRPQSVALTLNVDTLELRVAPYCMTGGNFIYRQVDKNHPKEQYLSMKSEKIPFRKPKAEIGAIKAAISRFAVAYKETLKQFKDVLMYKEYVDYETLLK